MATLVMPANCMTSAAAWAPVMRSPGASHTKYSGSKPNMLVPPFLMTPPNDGSNFDAMDVRRHRTGTYFSPDIQGHASASWQFLKALCHNRAVRTDRVERRVAAAR